jgi:hypothetical protein
MLKAPAGTEALIDTVLPEPDATRMHRHRRSGPRLKLYDRKRVDYQQSLARRYPAFSASAAESNGRRFRSLMIAAPRHVGLWKTRDRPKKDPGQNSRVKSV